MARYSITIQLETMDLDIVEGDLRVLSKRWNDEQVAKPLGYSRAILGAGEQHIDTRLSSPEKKKVISPE